MAKGEKVYSIEIEVINKRGTCNAGHEVGDTFLITGDTDRFSCQGICIHALYSMFPKFIAMRYGAHFPWANDDPDIALHACPDAANPVVFQLRRISKKEEL